jgi:hypothetical protein
MELCLNHKEISEMRTDELELVSGGRKWGTGRREIFSARNIAAGLRLAGAIGLVYSSYQFGHAIGSFGYSSYNYVRYGSKK